MEKTKYVQGNGKNLEVQGGWGWDKVEGRIFDIYMNNRQFLAKIKFNFF